MQQVKNKVTCNSCGGTRLLFDAYVKWDFEAQEYAITMVADKPIVCEDCDGEVSVTWKEELTPAVPLHRLHVKVDGTYPVQNLWLLELTAQQVIEIVNDEGMLFDYDTGEVIEATGMEQLGNSFINKGYVNLGRHGTALYKHDFKWWLIMPEGGAT